MACNNRRVRACAAVLRWLGALAALSMGAVAPVVASGGSQPIRVTTTLSVLKALVEAVGGERVRVEAIAAPQFDPHFIEPRPSDIVKLGRSDFFVHMGLDLELWRGPLVEAAVNPRLLPGGAGEMDASAGIPLLEVPERTPSRAQGDIHLFGNPHYWLDPANAIRMAQRIAAKLSEFSPADEELFRRGFEEFKADLERREAGWRARLSAQRGARLVAYHNSWPYFGQVFGFRIDLFLEPKPGIPPSGAHLEALVATMKKDAVRVAIIERHNPRHTAESVAERTGARVVELWQNPDAGMTYAGMMEHNVETLAAAFGPAPAGGVQ